MVPRAGFEPATYPLGGDRAIPCATGAFFTHTPYSIAKNQASQSSNRTPENIFHLTAYVNHTKMRTCHCKMASESGGTGRRAGFRFQWGNP